MKKGFVDLHTHSSESDGIYQRKELVKKAYEAGIRTLAITDHNYIEDIKYLQYKDMVLIQGSEISALFNDLDGNKSEIHIVALGFDENNEKIKDVIKRNQLNTFNYINMILEKLRLCDIDIGTYEYLKEINSGKTNFGRSLIAKEMVKWGYCKSVKEVLDEYIGDFGSKRAYVENPLDYVSLKEVIEAIKDASGIPVLAHLYCYNFDNRNNHYLLSEFKKYCGDLGAIEVYYGAYNQSQRDELKSFAKQYNLMVSCASDFHGHRNDCLTHGFSESYVKDILDLYIDKNEKIDVKYLCF